MIIYRATNQVNGRQYIGRTIQSLHKRKLRHFLAARTLRHMQIAFHNAIRKYGPDAFHFEVIETCSSLSDLLSAEQKHIAEHISRGVNLYNMTKGGDGSLGLQHGDAAKEKLRKSALSRNLRVNSPRCKPCVLNDVQYHSVTDAARKLDTGRATVQRWLRNGTFRVAAKRSDYKGFKEPFVVLKRQRARRTVKSELQLAHDRLKNAMALCEPLDGEAYHALAQISCAVSLHIESLKTRHANELNDG